jgi:putative ABC transport system permease protein
VLRGDRGITYASEPPANSEIVAGSWWPASGADRNELSFAAELARELGVGVGDTVRVNVLGREMEATITNLRTVEWESLSINFVMVFSPDVFAGAPHAHLATLTYPDGASEAEELRLLGEITDAFPTVTSVRVKEALEAVNGIVADLVLAIRAAAAVTLISAVLVLAGSTMPSC